MPSNLVVVATYPTTAEAGLAREFLESEGIACRMTDEMVVQWVWYLSNAIGGVKVLVAEEDAEKALALLAETGGLAPDLDEAATGDVDAEDDQVDPYPGDPMATRAWRAAVVGLFACPPLLHFYSAWVLMRLLAAHLPLSASGKRKVCGAVLVNAAVCALVSLYPLISLGWMSQFWGKLSSTLLNYLWC
jgi:hypothetical protein